MRFNNRFHLLHSIKNKHCHNQFLSSRSFRPSLKWSNWIKFEFAQIQVGHHETCHFNGSRNHPVCAMADRHFEILPFAIYEIKSLEMICLSICQFIGLFVLNVRITIMMCRRAR